MDLWYTENQTKDLRISFRIKKVIHEEQTPFQYLSIVDTEQYGRMMFLDEMVMVTEKDEFVFHEMAVHVALNTHPNPKNVLVIGGGDGGSIREILKHKKIENAVLVEIDERVVKTSQEFLPSIGGWMDKPRVTLAIGDGIKHVKDHKNKYDLIIMDCTEPVVAMSSGLFGVDFYKDAYECLTEDGILVAQSGSPYTNPDVVSMIQNNLRDIFPIKKIFTASIPTYPTGLWCLTFASKKYDPMKAKKENFEKFETKYYTEDLHFGCFQIPKFIQDLDKKP